MSNKYRLKKIVSAALFAGILTLSGSPNQSRAAAPESNDPIKLVLLDWTGQSSDKPYRG